MKLSFVLLLAFVAGFALVERAEADNLVTRIINRRIARIERLIEVLNNREKTLLGTARDAIQNQIEAYKDALKALRDSRKKEDTSDGASSSLRRRRDTDEVATDPPLPEVATRFPASLLQRLVRRLERQLQQLRREMRRATGQAREAFRVRYDALKERIDRIRNHGTATEESVTDAPARLRRDADEVITSKPSRFRGVIRRLERRVKELQRSMQQAVGQAREAFRVRIEAIKERINQFRAVTDAPAIEARERRAADDDEPAATEAPKTTATEAPVGLIARQIAFARRVIQNLESLARNAIGRQRTLLFRQIDLQRAILDRLLRRASGE